MATIPKNVLLVKPAVFNVEEKFQQLTETGSIIACGDVKFDIPTGSIFIIMGALGIR